jgi:hypothetical protein
MGILTSFHTPQRPAQPVLVLHTSSELTSRPLGVWDSLVSFPEDTLRLASTGGMWAGETAWVWALPWGLPIQLLHMLEHWQQLIAQMSSASGFAHLPDCSSAPVDNGEHW